MNGLDAHEQDTAIIGRGEAERLRTNPYAERVKSVVRYADPAAWTVVAAIDQALIPLQNDYDPQRVGAILVSECGPTETIADFVSSARRGLISPMRFPAASSSSLLGLACIVFGFQGPCLNLTMPPDGGVPIAYAIAKRWINRDVVKFAIIATHEAEAGGQLSSRCLLLTSKGSLPEPGEHESPGVSWLYTKSARPVAMPEDV